MNTTIQQRKKGAKLTMLGLSENESVKFPRKNYSNVRNAISIIKIEYPERTLVLDVVEDGILVTCLK